MNKKIITGIIAVIVIAIVGVGGYFLLSNKRATDAPTETKQPDEEVKVGNEDSKPNKDGKKSLVVYFSVPETDDPNKKMTTEEENSAIVIDGKVLGNAQYAAMLIREFTGGDLYRIEPKTPYTTNHRDLVTLAKEEQNKDVRPEIKNKISKFDEYDIIYVGYPIWWSDMPQILYTFFELYDFNGKTVIPFSTHGGSGLAGTVSTIKNKLSGSYVESNAFTMSRNDMESAPEEIKSWLKEIEKLENSIERRKKLLANENYFAKAPQNLVKEEREKLK